MAAPRGLAGAAQSLPQLYIVDGSWGIVNCEIHISHFWAAHNHYPLHLTTILLRRLWLSACPAAGKIGMYLPW